MSKWILLALLFVPTVALAQPATDDEDVDLDRGPTAELYIRKRPPTPEGPSLSPELQKLLTEAQEKRDAKRSQAIGLLRQFLDGKPEGDTRADGLFKLAELLWEDSRRIYLEKADKYEREVERCKTRKCKKEPVEPRVDLSESETLYKELIADFPAYQHADLAMYLIGFAAKEDGREDEALVFFKRVIDEHPDSPLYGDCWILIGEHYFAAEQFKEAREAYLKVLDRKKSSSYELALFKTAWCDWKLGDIDSAIERLSELIGIVAGGDGVEDCRGASKHRCALKEEALEYLVIIFTEDRTITAKEVYDFVASVGGDTYARDVLIKVAEAYTDQSEYERSNATYQFLIELDPGAISAAGWQRKIMENAVTANDPVEVQAQMKALVEGYGPSSPWARHQKGQADAVAKSIGVTEELVRTTAMSIHADAQEAETRDKKPDKALFEAAAEAYAIYLSGYGGGGEDKAAASDHAAELRYYRADILYRKLGQKEAAGDEFLAVGKSAPVGKWHKDALKLAIKAFEESRPKDTAGKQKMYPVDKKFSEAISLYVTLFKDDPDLVDLIFKNGQLFYDYGDYDEAIKLFGLIVTEFPDSENAKFAGERILKALDNGKDYENVEAWARRLKKAKAFKDKKEQARLDEYIVNAIGKSGDAYADAGKYEKAASFYLRVPKEFPKHPEAAEKMENAGVMYEKAKQPERAAEIYLDLAENYKTKQGDAAAFNAGQLYEQVAYFDRAADAYELHFKKFPQSKRAADSLYNAGVLRHALGQHEKAIEHYQKYASTFKDRDDAAEVAFRIGAVYEDAGDDGRADQAFRAFIKSHKGHKRVVEAHVRSGRTSMRLGQLKRAGEQLGAVLKMYGKAKGAEKAALAVWAAEARYWQGEILFKEFEKVSLDVKPTALEKTLKKKTDLLVKAQVVYLGIVDYGDLRWTTTALYRVGNTFEIYGEALRAAPIPTDVSEADAERWREQIESTVFDVEEKAIELYEAGYKKSLEIQVYDANTTKMREALGRLSPDNYPPLREGIADERAGDRPIDVPVVKEVSR